MWQDIDQAEYSCLKTTKHWLIAATEHWKGGAIDRQTRHHQLWQKHKPGTCCSCWWWRECLPGGIWIDGSQGRPWWTKVLYFTWWSLVLKVYERGIVLMNCSDWSNSKTVSIHGKNMRGTRVYKGLCCSWLKCTTSGYKCTLKGKCPTQPLEFSYEVIVEGIPLCWPCLGRSDGNILPYW